jgi:hypothetical protein
MISMACILIILMRKLEHGENDELKIPAARSRWAVSMLRQACRETGDPP